MLDPGSESARLFAQAAAIHESSARTLRAGGNVLAAVRVEQFAALARDAVIQPHAFAQMHTLAMRLRDSSTLPDLLDRALDGAITFLAADFGNIQILDPRTRALTIVSQRGFGAEFLDYFAVVTDENAACGRAATARAQAVIADVDADAGFAPHRAIAAASGFRAVQSTPLIDRNGRLQGVISTHFHRPHAPAAHELRMTETYGRLVADAIARRVNRA